MFSKGRWIALAAVSALTGCNTANTHIGDDAAFVGEVLRVRQPMAVMHFAGSIVVEDSVRDPIRYFENNTVQTLSLIKAWTAAGGGPFIFSSTAAVYGMPELQPVREDAPKNPMSPYGASKLMSEVMIAAAAAAMPAFRPVCLRYFNVAGADPALRTGQRGPQSTHLIRVAIETALGLRERMSVFGTDYDTRDGTCERDFIHVSDLATAHIAALDYLLAGGAPATFNCGYGSGYTVLEVLAALEALSGKPLPRDLAPRRPGDPARLIADPTALRETLAWEPRYADLTVILETALAWQTGRSMSLTPTESR